MARVLVLYYSSYGHIERLAQAIAEGARSAGTEVVIKRVPELVPDEVARAGGYKLDQAAQIATVEELSHYDAIVFGTPTRFGTMAAQMKNFLDQTGGLWSGANWSVRLVRSLHPAGPSMAARRQLFSPASRSFSIMA